MEGPPRRGAVVVVGTFALALVVLIAAWFLRGPEAGPATAPPPDPADATATGPAAPPPSVSTSDTHPRGPAEAAGAVTGSLAIPGDPAAAATLTVLRDGSPVAALEARPGPFRVEYARTAADAAAFSLRAETARRPPALLPLPAPVHDVGEVRLLAGLVYGGRLVDRNALPVAGAVVGFALDGRDVAVSPPSGLDGAFLIPLPAAARLQGLYGDPAFNPVAAPSIEARIRGRLFLPVPAVPEGLAGSHEVVLEERPVSIRLRFLDQATGRPATGATVSLLQGAVQGGGWLWADPFVAGRRLLDEGATDDDGVFAPIWPKADSWVLLRVRERGGRVLWSMLDRVDAAAMQPRDLVLPRDPVVVAARCTDASTEKPMAAVQLVLATNARDGFPGTTDASGEARWALFASESFDPEPLQVTGWTATWRDAAGHPRREMDFNVDYDPLVVLDAENEDAPAVPNEPLRIRLGARPDPGIWVSVKSPAGAAPFAPQFLQVATGMENGSFAIFSGQFSGPYAAASGSSLWWTWQSGLDDTLRYIPADRKVKAELKSEGLAPLVLDVDRARVKAAHRAEEALVFEVPVIEVMTRTVRVLLPDGKPAAGAFVVVLAGATPATWSSYENERERTTAGADGAVSLVSLDPRGDCRVLAWHPPTGAGAVTAGLDEAAKPDRWTLALEAPRELRVRVRLAGDAPMTQAGLGLASYSTAVPMIPMYKSKDGDFRVPGVAFPLYRAVVYGMGPRDYRYAYGTPASFDGKDVVLEKPKK
jgi:hypothetical protein